MQERIQKILARGGIASRRAAEAMILEGRVRVNGRVVKELGAKADPRNDRVELDGKRVVAETAEYWVLHKPRGVVTTMSDPEGRPTVRDLLKHVKTRVFPVGRLDFGTSGVILFTNDGAFSDGLLHPKKAVPKTYVVKVEGEMADKMLDRWRSGIVLEDGKTLKATVNLIRYENGKTWFEITITEGRNQQIRRMGEATGHPIMRLARVSFAGVTVEGLRPGSSRLLTRPELVDIRKAYGVPKTLPRDPGENRTYEEPRGRRTAENRAPRRSQDTRPSRDPSSSYETKGRASNERSSARRESASRNSHSSESKGARYGGGSPGRRGYNVREDWGGGAERNSRRQDDSSIAPPGRGSSGSRSSSSDSARGRSGGNTRTTGSSGGIGGNPQDSASYRVKGRRGGR